ncbi:cyclin-dependent kinase 11B-like isoform X2 [Watersipora subatra]
MYKHERTSARDDRPPAKDDRAYDRGHYRDDRAPARDDRVSARDDRALQRDDRLPARDDRLLARDDRAYHRDTWTARDERGSGRDRPRDDRYRGQTSTRDVGYSRGDVREIRPLMSTAPRDLRDTLSRPIREEIRVSPSGRVSKNQSESSSNRLREVESRQDRPRHRSRSPLEKPKERGDKPRRDVEREKVDNSAKSGSTKASEKVAVVELSGDESEGEEQESGSEEESGSGEEEEEEASSSGEEVEESGSEQSGSEEEEEESGDESEEEAESEASESQSEAESDDKADNDKRNGQQHKNKSKFESESESDEEGPEEPVAAAAANGDHSGSEVEMAPSPEMSDPPTPPPKLPLYYPALQGCRSVDDFRHLNRIEEGTYGVVFRAEDRKKKEIVALKRLKMEKEKEGFPITSLREINTLLKTQHENIVTVREIVVGSNMDKIYVVMDFVEHDLKALMESMKTPFAIGEVKTLLLQLLKAVAHMHDNWILHRDLKTSNLLLSHKGILKVGDFGLAREYGSPLKPYTPVVVTLWYRAPELLLGCKQYSTAIDLWSVGCIFAEMLLMKALWPGKNEIDELNKIFKDMGTPNERIWQGVSEMPAMKKCNFSEYPYNTLKNRFAPGLLDDCGYDLLNKFLTYDPRKRVTAEDAKTHRYFDIHPLPVDPSMFPTWPARSEQPRGKREKTPKPPSGGQAYKLLNADDVGFHLGATNPNTGFNLKF